MKLNEGKVLITGGSQGIGLEAAKLLRSHGAQVAICARNEERLRQAADTCGAIPIVADVSNEADAVGCVETAIEQMGGLNVLVNNAAYGYFEHLANIDMERFNAMMAVNVTGVMLMGREAAKHFAKVNYGNIINISSTAGTKGFAHGTPYVASKFAMKGMTECWRAELRQHNVRVMQINPSEVQTDFGVNAGFPARTHFSERKLRSDEIAHAIKSVLEMDDRGFITELSVFATNPD